MATPTENKIRIRLKAYDHSAIETAAKEIVETATRTELIQPIAMDAGLRFAIREGGRTVGSGVVTEIIE